MADSKLAVVAKFPQSDAAKVKGQTPLELLEEFVAEVRAGTIVIRRTC